MKHCSNVPYAALIISSLVSVPITLTADFSARADDKVMPSSSTPDSGLSLPPGFSASIFADKLGHARHLVVAPDGTVYVNLWSGRYYKDQPAEDAKFLVALRDKNADGKADEIHYFGATAKEGSAGGTGIALYKNKLYAEVNDKILAYSLPQDGSVPAQKPETIVSGLPITGDHPMHPFVIGKDGALYVDLGSATNSCQKRNRMTASPGNDPCTELQTRAGLWRYDANKTGQIFSPAERFAMGNRNGEGLAFDQAGRLYATQHGRDQLAESWGNLYTIKQGQELPAEELMQVNEGDDFGWPFCYYDAQQKKLVLAPEYGGDGGKKIGICGDKKGPVAAYPAHWAPNALAFYESDRFPEAYKSGAFIAFHGSWNRAPGPQDGYNVVFQPFADGHPAGDYILFADGFAGTFKEPGRAAHRPSGLAIGPEGALYISDDQNGRIYRITYKGDASAKLEPASPAKAAAATGKLAEPPEGSDPNAGRRETALTLPLGAKPDQVQRGAAIFQGTNGGTCGGCHGGDATGSPIGPDLTSGQWQWGDGSLNAIKQTILKGVAEPKNHPGAMPPKGGADLSDADIDALAVYVYAISRKKS